MLARKSQGPGGRGRCGCVRRTRASFKARGRQQERRDWGKGQMLLCVKEEVGWATGKDKTARRRGSQARDEGQKATPHMFTTRQGQSPGRSVRTNISLQTAQGRN